MSEKLEMLKNQHQAKHVQYITLKLYDIKGNTNAAKEDTERREGRNAYKTNQQIAKHAGLIL